MSQPIRVLLVDDEESFRKPLMALLKEKGFEVDQAASGPEGLQRANARDGNYQVAIIDQVMGPPNGTETMKQLRSLYPSIEVIILTGWGDMEPGHNAMQEGAYRYMSKPLGSADELALNIRLAARYGEERQQRRHLQFLVKAGQTISAAESEQDLYEDMYSQVSALLPALDSFLIALYDAAEHVVSFPFCYVHGQRQPARSRRAYSGITEYVIESGQPLLLSDGDEVFRQQHGLQPPQIIGGCVSEIAVPIFLSGKVVGTVGVLCDQPDVRYTTDHLELLQAFANQAALALHNLHQQDEARIWLELEHALSTCSHAKAAYTLFAEHARRALAADFAVFYPHDPTAPPDQPRLTEKDCVQVGELRQPWQPPRGGLRGGVHRALDGTSQGVLIVNDIGSTEGQLSSRLSRREGVKAFLAVRLELMPDGNKQPWITGALFLNFRRRTLFEPKDVIGLQLAARRVAGVIQRLHLLGKLRDEQRDLNRRLRAVVGIFQSFRDTRDLSAVLDHVARAIIEALSLDICTILEYDQEMDKFCARGAAGLQQPHTKYTLPNEFKPWFLDKSSRTVILNASSDDRLSSSRFVRREHAKTVVVQPLSIAGEPLGLLFASYRTRRDPAEDELDGICLFADLAALVMHEVQLRQRIARTEKRWQRRLLVDYVSTIDSSSLHSLTMNAATIRNLAAILQKRLAGCTTVPSPMDGVSDTIAEIDRLAAQIAGGPPRPPQGWELEKELVPLAPFLEELAQRESKQSPLRTGPPVQIKTELKNLGGVQVLGHRRWLTYGFEALINNARNAMPAGGTVTIAGELVGDWAEVRVRDTGTGVPEGMRHRLFEQLTAKEQDEAGMGVGALLTAGIVEDLHAGSIALEKPGPGDTTVLIRLPMARKAQRR